jgi:hypothetical protein
MESYFTWKQIFDWLEKGVVTTVFLSILAFLFRNWFGELLKHTIQLRFDKDLESYRAQLKAQSDANLERLKSELKGDSERELERLKADGAKEIEQLKAQLQIQAAERNIRLTRVFEETANVIAKTFSLLVQLNDAVFELVHCDDEASSSQRMEKFKRIASLSQQFREYYQIHRIYIPLNTANKATQLWRNLERQLLLSDDIKRLEGRGDDSQNLEQQNMGLSELSIEILKMLDDLEVEFRHLLAVTQTESNKLKN